MGRLKLLLGLFSLVAGSAHSATLPSSCPALPARCTTVQDVVVGITNEGPILKDPVWAMLFRQNLRALARKVNETRTVEILISGAHSNSESFRTELLGLRGQCFRIKALLVDGHGHPGRQETAGQIHAANVDDYFRGLDCLMAPQATVQFSGCNAGEGCVGWHLLALTGTALLTKGGEIYGATVRRVPTFVDGHTDFGFHKSIEFNSNGGIARLRKDWPLLGEGEPESSCLDRINEIAGDLRSGTGIPRACAMTPFSACLRPEIQDRCQFQTQMLERDFQAALAAHRNLALRFRGVSVPFSDTPVHRAEAAKMLDLEGSVDSFRSMDCYSEFKKIPDANPGCLSIQMQSCLRGSASAVSCPTL